MISGFPFFSNCRHRCRPFPDFAGAMSLKMSLTANVSEPFASEDLAVKFLHFTKHCGVYRDLTF